MVPVRLLWEGSVLKVQGTIELRKVDNTIEERHLSLTALLTQSPGSQNAFDPVLMGFGMLTGNWRQKRKTKERKRECQKERVQLLQKPSNWMLQKMTKCSV